MGTKRLSTTILCIAPLLAFAMVGLAGCAADAEEDTGAAEAANSTDAGPKNPTYEAVRRSPKIANRATPGGATSAETTLLGYIPGDKVSDTLGKIAGVRRWPEITNEDGSRVFTAARVSSDNAQNGTRTVRANVTLDGDIALDTKLVAQPGENGSQKVTITNTSGYRHWLAGQVLDPNGLAIELELVPYQGGVIVNAKARVKLNSQEQMAPGITSYVVPIFNWLKAD